MSLINTLLDSISSGISSSSSSSSSAMYNSTSSSFNSGESSNSLAGIVFTIFLILALLLSILWLHESLAVLIMGTLVGCLEKYVLPNSLGLGELFSPGVFSEVFYKVLFPPIIFNAGFTLKRRNFMKNIGSILTVAFLGTILSSIFNLIVFYNFGKNLGIGSDDFVECFIFAALLSCTDTVATVAVLVEINVQPLLYSLVFGESMLNDAVAICLVRALTPYVGSTISGKTIGNLTLSFIEIVFGSFFVGAVVGFFAAFLAAREAKWNLSSTYQMTQILILAYFSYELAEFFEFSGIISLFVCAIIMSHYCWYSISVNSRKSLFQISGLLDFVSEVLVFMSFGILLFSSDLGKGSWNIIFIIIVICSILISRLASVLILVNILNIFRKDKIPFKFQIVLWWCGMRGIVGLLLVLGLDDKKFHNRSLFLSTTYVVIFFTNIVIGILTRPLVANLGVRSEVEGVNTLDPSATMSRVSIDSVKKQRSAFARWWFIVDNKYLKKLFGGRQRILDESNIRSSEVNEAPGKIEVIGESGSSGTHPQSLNAAGTAAVAIMSESDVSDAEKVAVSNIGSDSTDESDVNDDDDEDEHVIAPISDTIRFIDISDTGDDEPHHHHHHHHHNYRSGSGTRQGRSVSRPKSSKSYGSFSKSLVFSSRDLGAENDDVENDLNHNHHGNIHGSESLVIMDRIGEGNDDEKASLLK